MNKKPIILGIESSCDETAASILTENEQGLPVILSNIVSSQVDVHKEFGGVVPELAARSHIEKIDLITKKAINESGVKIQDIDAIASTAGPGLIVCLSVGLSFGKAMASSLDKPFIAVNHLEGHALSPKLNSNLNYPYLLLLISGGHTQFLSVKDLGNYKRLGTTIDDAVGEAFDKTAKLLGIAFPGGPQIEVYASKGDPNKYELPKPIFHKGGCNLSFAGLKTAVLKISKQIKTEQEKYDLAASFQKTVEEILLKKSKIAFEEFKKINNTKKNIFVVAGGVAANKNIRSVLENLCADEKFEAIFPPVNLCGDNAAMIAMVGLEKFKLKQFSKLDHPAKPRWPLDEDAIFSKRCRSKTIMQYWLMKSEPDVWSIDQQKKAGAKGAPWDGVRNYQAAKNLKGMKKGDLCFFYHSNIGKEIVGIIEVIKESFLDKTDESGRFVAVQVRFREKLVKSVTLEDIKKNKALSHLSLIKQSRLSVMPIDSKSWKIINKMSNI